MENYERKFDLLVMIQGGKCFITGKRLERSTKVDLHHVGKPNTKVNRRRWPQAIDSLINLALVDHDAHMSKALPRYWPDWVMDGVEARLAADPDLSDLVNGRAPNYDIKELKDLWLNVWGLDKGA